MGISYLNQGSFVIWDAADPIFHFSGLKILAVDIFLHVQLLVHLPTRVFSDSQALDISLSKTPPVLPTPPPAPSSVMFQAPEPW